MIEKIKEPNENTRNYLALSNPNILAVWDKINEIIDGYNEQDKKINFLMGDKAPVYEQNKITN